MIFLFNSFLVALLSLLSRKMRINSKPATDILKHIGINAGASGCRDIFYLFMLFRNSVVSERWTGCSESNYNLKARVFFKNTC